jgi:uncharacterized damage-inducible protein DinB
MTRETAQLFLDTARKSLVDEHWPRLRECAASLSEEQLWWRPNDSSNSIGNLLMHLNGNVGQWIVATFNGTEDHRNRPGEFSQREPLPAAALLKRLSSTVEEASATIARLAESDLLRTYEIQGYSVTGLYAIFHCVEHFSHHYGQIAYITKTLQNRDLGFWSHLDKTGRAK